MCDIQPALWGANNNDVKVKNARGGGRGGGSATRGVVVSGLPGLGVAFIPDKGGAGEAGGPIGPSSRTKKKGTQAGKGWGGGRSWPNSHSILLFPNPFCTFIAIHGVVNQ